MHQRRPAQRELELDVLLEIAAERGAVEVVAQVKLPAGHQHVDLALDCRGQQRQHALWTWRRGRKSGMCEGEEESRRKVGRQRAH